MDFVLLCLNLDIRKNENEKLSEICFGNFFSGWIY